MRIISRFIKWYMYITTGILIVCAVNITLEGDGMISVSTLWEILLSGFLTAIVTLVFSLAKDSNKYKSWWGFFLHYVSLCAVMITCGKRFGWLRYNAEGICMMLLSVAVVYAMSAGTYFLLDVRQADEINQKLQEKYPEDD